MSQPQLNERQRRVVAVADLEMRVSDDDGQPPRIQGYAAVFDQPSEIMSELLGTYREYIKPGAFARSISTGADVRALLNHNPDFVLGRTKNSTLSLREDDKGLWYEVTPPETQWARDLVTTMRRGDIDQSSFAFRIAKEEWRQAKTADGKKIDERIVIEAQLFDISPVTYPAYPQTTSAVRSLTDLGIDDDVARAFDRARRGLPLSESEHAVMRATLDHLNALLLADPASAGHSATAGSDPAPSGHSVLRRESPVLIDAIRAERLRARLDRMAQL
jgi:HK97 family phage prohead protease